YEKSYANPAYAVKVLGDQYGQLLSAVYAKIAGSITHNYQGDIKYLCIYAELIVELYNYFENANELSPDEIRCSVVILCKNLLIIMHERIYTAPYLI
ncbi:hypothetical protein NE450_15325, partial [[Eubacterium] rectale]|nr:hypothetical protein [Agathobacter rectalis]